MLVVASFPNASWEEHKSKGGGVHLDSHQKLAHNKVFLNIVMNDEL